MGDRERRSENRRTGIEGGYGKQSNSFPRERETTRLGRERDRVQLTHDPNERD